MMPSTIRMGDKGATVRQCQEYLTGHGFPTATDSHFGPATQSKVMQFQRSRSLAVDGIVGNKTWTELEAEVQLSAAPSPPGPLPPVLMHMKSLGYPIIWKGDHHLILFGIRNKNPKANSFDDTLGCAYTEKGLWTVHFWPATCDPGSYHLKNPSRVVGTAIMAPGFYENAYSIGLHAGKYEAICQRRGPVVAFRDSDKTEMLTMEPRSKAEGYFGLNLHRSSIHTDTVEEAEKALVERWSAGCQVHARIDAFETMMTLARRQRDVLGISSFSYCLMENWTQ